MEIASAEQVIAKAIEKEIDAYNLYTKTADLVNDEAGKEMLKKLAAQEQDHQRKLENLKPDELESIDSQELDDEVVTSHLMVRSLSADADVQEIVVYAIKREEEAKNFYLTMAGGAGSQQLKNLFLHLAKEEKGHKEELNQTFSEITYTDR